MTLVFSSFLDMMIFLISIGGNFALWGEFLFRVEKEPKDAGGIYRGKLRLPC